MWPLKVIPNSVQTVEKPPVTGDNPVMAIIWFDSLTCTKVMWWCQTLHGSLVTVTRQSGRVRSELVTDAHIYATANRRSVYLTPASRPLAQAMLIPVSYGAWDEGGWVIEATSNLCRRSLRHGKQQEHPIYTSVSHLPPNLYFLSHRTENEKFTHHTLNLITLGIQTQSDEVPPPTWLTGEINCPPL